MKITTTAGEVRIWEFDHLIDDDRRHAVAVVEGTPDAIQAMYDGIVMSGGLDEGPGDRTLDHLTRSDGKVIVTVDKTLLAVWVQFEILNFLTYTELPEEMK